MTSDELREIGDNWATPRAELAVAQARVAELERDKARMDWFETRAFTAYRSRDPEHGTLEKWTCLVDEDRHRNFEGRRGIVHPTLRECVDEAMKESE